MSKKLFVTAAALVLTRVVLPFATPAFAGSDGTFSIDSPDVIAGRELTNKRGEYAKVSMDMYENTYYVRNFFEQLAEKSKGKIKAPMTYRSKTVVFETNIAQELQPEGAGNNSNYLTVVVTEHGVYCDINDKKAALVAQKKGKGAEYDEESGLPVRMAAGLASVACEIAEQVVKRGLISSVDLENLTIYGPSSPPEAAPEPSPKPAKQKERKQKTGQENSKLAVTENNLG